MIFGDIGGWRENGTKPETGSVMYLLKVAGSKLCLFIRIRIINKEYYSVGMDRKGTES